jgi:hypothetical protein
MINSIAVIARHKHTHVLTKKKPPSERAGERVRDTARGKKTGKQQINGSVMQRAMLFFSTISLIRRVDAHSFRLILRFFNWRLSLNEN